MFIFTMEDIVVAVIVVIILLWVAVTALLIGLEKLKQKWRKK